VDRDEFTVIGDAESDISAHPAKTYVTGPKSTAMITTLDAEQVRLLEAAGYGG
jgi:hypothetical protein